MQEKHNEIEYQRWDIHQRIQHFFLLISFTLLMMTGLPLKFPDSTISKVLMYLFGGVESAGKLHRIAASVLILVSIYHVIYLVYKIIKRKNVWAMLPRWKDVQDLLGMLKYLFGIRPDRPRFDRYTFTEKFEYWAVIWGSAVMIITGFIMWFPVFTTRILPGIFMPLSKVIHSYEALLAALAIVIWHFYHAHLSPDVFPMSRIWLTGRITEKELIHKHPLEFERMKRSNNSPGINTNEANRNEFPSSESQ
ncbi:MAG: cytochrome b/b6 domain-containing protein [Candidatus Poribacteria bacterium]